MVSPVPRYSLPALFVLLVACRASAHQPAFVCTLQDAVCEALGNFYNSTGGPAWSTNTGWAAAASGVATDYCTFVNVGCDGYGNANRLSLFLTSLSGTIPASIGGLTALQYLDLSLNGLSGTIPAAIGQLTMLKTLYLCVSICVELRISRVLTCFVQAV